LGADRPRPARLTCKCSRQAKQASQQAHPSGSTAQSHDLRRLHRETTEAQTASLQHTVPRAKHAKNVSPKKRRLFMAAPRGLTRYTLHVTLWVVPKPKSPTLD